MDYSLIVSIHFKTDAYRDLISRRNSEDIRDPKFQLREAFEAPVSLKREAIENQKYANRISQILRYRQI